MSDRKPPPDPDMRIAIVAVLSPQEAALLAGRLEAEGIRAMVSEGRSAPGPWVAIPGFPVPANPFQRGTAEVLVDERDGPEASRIAQRYLRRRGRTRSDRNTQDR